jgi:hypothetical protein
VAISNDIVEKIMTRIDGDEQSLGSIEKELRVR